MCFHISHSSLAKGIKLATSTGHTGNLPELSRHTQATEWQSYVAKIMWCNLLTMHFPTEPFKNAFLYMKLTDARQAGILSELLSDSVTFTLMFSCFYQPHPNFSCCSSLQAKVSYVSRRMKTASCRFQLKPPVLIPAKTTAHVFFFLTFFDSRRSFEEIWQSM